MRKLLLAIALLLGLSFARPAAAHAGFFFSFSQPGFGIAVGDPFYRPAYYYPPAPVVYVPPPVPVFYGGYGGYGGYYPRSYRSHGWGHQRHYRGHHWR